MGFFLSIIKFFLIVGCFRLANECDDWRPPTVVFVLGKVVLFAIDGEFQVDDFAQLIFVSLLACGMFLLFERFGGATRLAMMLLGPVILMVL